MKKYLMTGIAAVAMCAAFTSCSHDLGFEQMDQDQVDKAKYESVFVNRFGQPAADQDWGYAEFARKTTRTADPRGNMWAAEGWDVPPVITDAQKDIVRRYFQQNTPLGYNDPGWTDFWIQQVYKGGTKTTDGSKTTEKYIIGNDDEVTGGDHMDHICSKAANGTEDHVNDFNNSDNNDWEGRMLMRSSSTYSFGYINSNATAIHYDKAALVNWRVIAQWAVEKGLESSVESSVLNDGWNRSYMGFDWEQALPDDCYKPIYDYSAGWSADLPGGFPILGYETFEFEGKTYRFLSANANQYAYDATETTFGGKQNYNDRPSDAIIRQLLSLGYLPYSDTLKDWIKLSTGADGYYSDWIVTLTEAKGKTELPPADVRIIAEDLTTNERGDFDFNDVVFDVIYNYKEGKSAIILQAAGGTYPLYVAGHEVHQKLGNHPTNVMINTGAGPNEDPVLIEIDAVTHGLDIEVKVEKPSGTLILEANKGRAPHKIAVKPTFEWCSERDDIELIYKNFSEWVKDPSVSWY